MNPLVILIGGKGTSGKSTFISYVQQEAGADKCKEFSTIDPVKEVVRGMFAQEEAALIKSLNINTYYTMNELALIIKENNKISPLYHEIMEKTDVYRSLLHDIKMLWCAIDDGPNVITFCLIQQFFSQGGTIAFVNCREPEQFDHIKETLTKDKPDWNVLSLNVIRDNTDNWSNEGDRETDNYNYDMTIMNNGTLEELKANAHQFYIDLCK